MRIVADGLCHASDSSSDGFIEAFAPCDPSALQVLGDAALDPVYGAAQHFDDHQVDDGGPDIGLEVECARIGQPCDSHQVVDGDDGDDGRTLDHQDDLITVRSQCDDRRLWQNDFPHGLYL